MALYDFAVSHHGRAFVGAPVCPALPGEVCRAPSTHGVKTGALVRETEAVATKGGLAVPAAPTWDGSTRRADWLVGFRDPGLQTGIRKFHESVGRSILAPPGTYHTSNCRRDSSTRSPTSTWGGPSAVASMSRGPPRPARARRVATSSRERQRVP